MVHIIAKCLRAAGKPQIESHYIYYEPERQVVDVLKAAVITPDGREIDRANIQDESTSAASGVQTRIYDQHHLKYVQFNNLEVRLPDRPAVHHPRQQRQHVRRLLRRHVAYSQTDGQPAVGDASTFSITRRSLATIQTARSRPIFRPEHIPDDRFQPRSCEMGNRQDGGPDPEVAHAAGWSTSLLTASGHDHAFRGRTWANVCTGISPSEQLEVSDEMSQKNESRRSRRTAKTDTDEVRAVQLTGQSARSAIWASNSDATAISRTKPPRQLQRLYGDCKGHRDHDYRDAEGVRFATG